MFCNKCGKEIPEGTLCVECQLTAAQAEAPAAENITEAALSEPVLTEVPGLTEGVLTEPSYSEAAPAGEVVVEPAPIAVAPVEEAAVEPASIAVAPAGEVVVEPVPVAAAVPTPKKKVWPKVLGIVLSVILVLAIGAGALNWYLLMKNDKTVYVEETMERFCTSIEEMDFFGMLNCMFTDDLMDVVETYMSMGGMSFEDIQGLLDEEMAVSLGEIDLDSIDVDYRLVTRPTRVEGEELDDLTKILKVLFITDIEEVLKAEVELIMNTGEDSEAEPVELYFYNTDDKWYLIPSEITEMSGNLFG